MADSLSFVEIVNLGVCHIEKDSMNHIDVRLGRNDATLAGAINALLVKTQVVLS